MQQQLYSLLKTTIAGAEMQGLDQNALADLLVPLLQPDDRELDTPEAAAYCGKAVSTFHNYRTLKKGPKFRKDENGLIRYRIGWLKDWLNSGKFSDE